MRILSSLVIVYLLCMNYGNFNSIEHKEVSISSDSCCSWILSDTFRNDWKAFTVSMKNNDLEKRKKYFLKIRECGCLYRLNKKEIIDILGEPDYFPYGQDSCYMIEALMHRDKNGSILYNGCFFCMFYHGEDINYIEYNCH